MITFLQEVQKCTYTPWRRKCSNIAEELCAKNLLKVPHSNCLGQGSNPYSLCYRPSALTNRPPCHTWNESQGCGAWWLSVKFSALRLECHRFESHSKRHVGIVGKSFTLSCL